MDFAKKAQNRLHEELTQLFDLDAPLVVAVSGGVDSMVLMHMLYELKYTNVLIAHVDHMLRKTSSDDARLVETTAQRYGFDIIMHSCDVKRIAKQERISVEMAGRQERYTFFETLRMTRGGWILTAHHRDDVEETQLMNIFRGSGLNGLSPLPAIDQSRHLLRPLRHFHKKELQYYAHQQSLDWNEDETNSDSTLVRNFVRNVVLSPTREQFAHLSASLQTLELQSQDYLSMADELLTLYVTPEWKTKGFLYDVFCGLTISLQKHLVFRLLQEVKAPYPNQKQIASLCNSMRSMISGKHVKLSSTMRLERNFDRFELVDTSIKTKVNRSEKAEFTHSSSKISFENQTYQFSTVSSDSDVSGLSLKKEWFPLTIRYRDSGDKVIVGHSEQTSVISFKEAAAKLSLAARKRSTTPLLVTREGYVCAFLGDVNKGLYDDDDSILYLMRS